MGLMLFCSLLNWTCSYINVGDRGGGWGIGICCGPHPPPPAAPALKGRKVEERGIEMLNGGSHAVGAKTHEKNDYHVNGLDVEGRLKVVTHGRKR